MISVQISNTQTAEGLLSIALIKRKLTYATGVPRNLGNRQNKIQKKTLLLFPNLQETDDGPVVLEFMKIKSETQFKSLGKKIINTNKKKTAHISWDEKKKKEKEKTIKERWGTRWVVKERSQNKTNLQKKKNHIAMIKS